MKKELLLFEDNTIQGKPFLKWAGGKGQLIESIAAYLPKNMEEIAVYIEPFVGSGAVMFWILSKYPDLLVVINDLNSDLINVYNSIKYNVTDLISELKYIEKEYKSLETSDSKKEFYYQLRAEYNDRNFNYSEISAKMAALFIFLNRTCFNGLYRVNSKNGFNVPFGKYTNPKICDEQTLYDDSRLLDRVEILNGDYSETLKYGDQNTLFYFDPPYKPISETSNFNSYSSEVFADAQQIKLKKFCDTITAQGAKFILSNSDPRSVNCNNTFFDELYGNYEIIRVNAKRNINAKGNQRGEIKELLIRNFENI